jgi:hypothetical protein
MLLIILILLILFGFGGGQFYNGGAYRTQGFGIGTILIIILIVWLLMGNAPYPWHHVR